MMLRNAALLLFVAPTLSTGYLAEINNAHIDLLSNGASANTSENVVLEQLLENKLWGEHTASQIRDLFEAWVQRFERKYESLAEKVMGTCRKAITMSWKPLYRSSLSVAAHAKLHGRDVRRVPCHLHSSGT